MEPNALSAGEQLRGLTFLERIVRAIASSTDTASVMHTIVEETTEATHSQVCSVYTWNPDISALTLSATTGLPMDAIGAVRLGLGEGITGWVAEHRQPLAVEDVHQDPRFIWIPHVDDRRFVSMLSVPVVLGQRLLGVLNIQTQERHVFTRAEVDFLAAIAAHVASIVEITGLHRELALVRALRASEDRYRSIVETACEGILTLDPQGTIVYGNQRLAAILGFSVEELYGHCLDDFSLGVSYDEIRRLVSQEEPGAGGQFDAHVYGKGGTDAWVMVSGTPILDEQGELAEILVMLTDISERKAAEDRLKHQTLHDHLTGLPNRMLLEDRLQQALYTARREQNSVSVLLLDLDGFKEVNDSIGHAAGDLLLSEIGPRLRGILRASDTLARLGGDEFVLLLPAVGLMDASVVATKILRALEQPFVIDGHAMYVGASIGVVTFPEHGADAETLLRRADLAMYAAKRDRGTYVCYEEGQDPGRERLLLTAGLRTALGSSQLELHYQPQVQLSTGQVSGVEALIRWRHPERGLLPPSEFIPLAEQSGLIGPLCYWSLEHAIAQCRSWLDHGMLLQVAVNLSVRNLRDTQLPEQIERLVEEAGIEAGHLKLEVTESMLMTETERTIEMLASLKGMGVQISIDDFGTGYSSLSRLTTLPVNEIKIDKSFVLDVDENAAHAMIVRSTIDLAHNLGLTVVAEGVERKEAWLQLAEWGCDEAQGYFIARPLPGEMFTVWANEWLDRRQGLVNWANG